LQLFAHHEIENDIIGASLFCVGTYSEESQKIVLVSHLRISVSSADLLESSLSADFADGRRLKTMSASLFLLLSHLPLEISEEPIYFITV
jgi:hypothetical protein